MATTLKTYFNQQTKASPLAVFRIGFGLMMLASIIRFWYNGWIEKLYLEPSFHFSYYGFVWIKPIGNYTYFLFFFCGISALCIALGLFYRIAIISFFLSFTYIELMDKTTYLNHYYFVSIVSFVLIFLPANATFSIDNLFRRKTYENIPKWTIDSIKLLLGIVYFYAGLAKLNNDWLVRAQPLKTWLSTKSDFPIIGDTLMHQNWFHYAMSYGGLLYDLTIPFLLLYKRTRLFAFALVVFFHVFTRMLFPIGMFPFIMIISTLIFFDASFHDKIILKIKILLQFVTKNVQIKLQHIQNYRYKTTIPKAIVMVFLVIQLLFPWRYLLYPGELFWTEQGYRFSWRVMLMEKAGYAHFKVVEGETGQSFYVNNTNFLTKLQEKQMSFQPDFILEYAHFLGDIYTKRGYKNVQVFVDCFVTLNGRMSTRFIDPKVDLYQEKESFKNKTYILPFKDEIKGL